MAADEGRQPRIRRKTDELKVKGVMIFLTVGLERCAVKEALLTFAQFVHGSSHARVARSCIGCESFQHKHPVSELCFK